MSETFVTERIYFVGGVATVATETWTYDRWGARVEVRGGHHEVLRDGAPRGHGQEPGDVEGGGETRGGAPQGSA